jgi:hypothetical protein
MLSWEIYAHSANHSEEGVAPTQRAKMASVVTLIIEQNCLNSSIGYFV